MSDYTIQNGEGGLSVRGKLNSSIDLDNTLVHLSDWIFGDDLVAKTKYKSDYIIEDSGFTTVDETCLDTSIEEIIRLWQLGFETFLYPITKTGDVGFINLDRQGVNLVYPDLAVDAPFSRAGVAAVNGVRKVINSEGYLIDVAENVPAWTFPIGGSSAGCPYLSLLPTVENLIIRSEELDDPVWQKSLANINANSTTSPDGTANADELVEDGSAGEHFARTSAISVTSGTTYTLSVFAKANTRTLIRLGADDQGNLSGRAFYDLNTGSVTTTTGSPSSSGIIDMGNGWYLCYITAVASGTVGGVNSEINLVSSGTTVNYTGDGVSGAYLWGAMIKEGSYISPLDYVKTEATAIERQGDVIDDIDDLVGDGYLTSTSEGSLLLQLDVLEASASIQRIALQSTAGTNMVAFNYLTAGGFAIYDYLNGLYVYTNTEPEDFNKWIISWKDNNLSIYYNGFRVYDAALGDDYSINRLRYISTIDNNKLDFKMINFDSTDLTITEGNEASSWSSFDQMSTDLGYE